MAAPDPSSETAQTDGESADGADKPPHEPRRPSVPLPPPDAYAHPKEPGFTTRSLQQLVLPAQGSNPAPPGAIAKQRSVGSSSQTPSVTSSPTASDSDGCWSPPSTRPPSQAPSRHPSMSGTHPGAKLTMTAATPPVAGAATVSHRPPSISSKKSVDKEKPDTTVRSPSKPPSVHSADGGGHKFNLKDILASGPKLSRRSSARSTGSSKKSDSDGGGKSVAGDSVTSLSKKYGVCDKAAIGKGATSVVRLVHKWDRSEDKVYAVKEFRKRRKNESEKEYVKKLTAEFCISSTLHHANIVETVDLVQDEQARWCEVMEYCPGGDLYAAIKKGGMSPSEVECCFKQILCGVEYLHSQGVAHRDIKPENLFFDTKGHLKIGDYGASTVYRLPWEATIHMSSGLCGSEPYIAPEQFLGKPYDARLVDIWACGIVYYCLHFQELPWRAAQQTDTLYAAYASACTTTPPSTSSRSAAPAIRQTPSSSSAAGSSQHPQQFPSTITNLSPRSCRPILRRMLEPDPKKRALIEEVIKNSWVESIEVCHAVPEPKHVHVSARAMVRQSGF